MVTDTRRRLSKSDWVNGAWAMIADHGVGRLAVEPLAARLGTTKGSFYWHFADRAELLDAVLTQWRERATQDVMTLVEREPAEARVAVLLGHVISDNAGYNRADWAILSAADHPQIGPVVNQVHQERIDYLGKLFRADGLTARRADARARICYAAYLGSMQLTHDQAGGETDGDTYREEMMRMIGVSDRA